MDTFVDLISTWINLLCQTNIRKYIIVQHIKSLFHLQSIILQIYDIQQSILRLCPGAHIEKNPNFDPISTFSHFPNKKLG